MQSLSDYSYTDNYDFFEINNHARAYFFFYSNPQNCLHRRRSSAGGDFGSLTQ